MIFVSSTASKKTTIREAVEEIATYGFKNIELTGGTRFYPEYLADLTDLKEKYGLCYRLHNYFPPPERSFVLNLASNNETVLEQSRTMVKTAIDVSKTFGATQFGLHAGFRISPRVEELGKKISSAEVLPYENSLQRFMNEFNALAAHGAAQGVELLLENNVFSAANFKSFAGVNPFFLTNSEEYFALKARFSFPLLLDIAHLKVSSKTLGLEFDNELPALLSESSYIHISDNDGLSDSNHEFSSASDFIKTLKRFDLSKKTFTIEVYDGLDQVRRCFELLDACIRGAA